MLSHTTHLSGIVRHKKKKKHSEQSELQIDFSNSVVTRQLLMCFKQDGRLFKQEINCHIMLQMLKRVSVYVVT